MWQSPETFRTRYVGVGVRVELGAVAPGRQKGLPRTGEMPLILLGLSADEFARAYCYRLAHHWSMDERARSPGVRGHLRSSIGVFRCVGESWPRSRSCR